MIRELRRKEESQGIPLHASDVHEVDGMVDLGCLHELTDLDLPELDCTPFVPAEPFRADASMFDVVARRDVLVHHPYDSFDGALPGPSRRRPGRDGDQAHVVSARWTDGARRGPPARGGARQGRLGLRRGEGPIRRRTQYLLGQATRTWRHPRRNRPREVQDAREARARGAARGRSGAAVRAHRDRQLQPDDCQPVHRSRPHHDARRHLRRSQSAVQRADRLIATARRHVPAPPRGADQYADAIPGVDRARGRACTPGAVRRHPRETERRGGW